MVYGFAGLDDLLSSALNRVGLSAVFMVNRGFSINLFLRLITASVLISTNLPTLFSATISVGFSTTRGGSTGYFSSFIGTTSFTGKGSYAGDLISWFLFSHAS